MHATARQFVRTVRDHLPGHFENHAFKVLNVGSLAVNWNNANFFAVPGNVFGVDIMPGPGVDLVTPIHEFEHAPFMTVICTSMLEHDKHWQLSIQQMIRLTMPGGLLLITCAGPGYLEHMTATNPVRVNGQDVFLDHYRNIGIEDLHPLLGSQFEPSHLVYQEANHDTFFWGLKRS